jgi:hypothetical protein
MAFTGLIFRTNNAGMLNAKKQTMAVEIQTNVTCHQIIFTGATET